MKHFIHMTPEERIAEHSSRTADSLDAVSEKLDTATEAIRENSPKNMMRKLEEVKSANLITNQTLKKIKDRIYEPIKPVELLGVIKGDKGDPGRNPLIVSKTEPVNPQIGDLWYQP